MKNKLKNIGKYSVSFGLMGIFLYWAFKDIQAGELWDAARSISPLWLVWITCTTFFTLYLRAWRWIVLMKPFAPAVTVRDAFKALAICYTANMVVPRSGEALRALSIKWSRNAPISPVLATVLVERIIDMVWLMVFLGISVLLLKGRITEAFPHLNPGTFQVLSLITFFGCISALVVLVLISMYERRALALVERLLVRVSPGLAAKISGFLATFLSGLIALRNPSAYFKIAVSSTAMYLGYAGIVYQAFWAMHMIRDYALGVDSAVVILSISSIGFIVPTPGGAGSYHLLFGEPLNLLYGVPLAQAMACATLIHAMASAIYLLLGAPALFLQRLKVGKKTASQDVLDPPDEPIYTGHNDLRQPAGSH